MVTNQNTIVNDLKKQIQNAKDERNKLIEQMGKQKDSAADLQKNDQYLKDHPQVIYESSGNESSCLQV